MASASTPRIMVRSHRGNKPQDGSGAHSSKRGAETANTLSPKEDGKSVTYVSGTICYLYRSLMQGSKIKSDISSQGVDR
jgi:hypothetical protein